MRNLARRLAALATILMLPAGALAQTSTIAGEVRDTSGAVLPGVTVEAASPALIEKVRSATTDESGRYSIVQLRPGVYTVSFSLPGFSSVKREGIEVTSDFTAAINAEMRVGAIAETVTVVAESPVVDMQGIAQRTVMTRDVLDAIPTGRNIQAVGIMIPGMNISFGGGAALSRDVGGSGSLQQSPLNYRGSADAVQTVDNMRLNNLEGVGAFSGVYWNDGSWQEISYVTGADSAEMPTAGIRINMVPKDGGNTFRGTVVANFTGEGWDSGNLRDNLAGDLTTNPNNRVTSVSRIRSIWDVNPSIGGPIVRDRLWWQFTFRHWGVEKTVPDAYFNASPEPNRYVPDLSRPGVDDGHIVSRAARLTWQASSKDKVSYYHDDQAKYRDHWGISSVVIPEATAVQVTPTSYVSVTKWTRTQTNRLLLDFGFAVYSQEFTELYQPGVTGMTEKIWDEAAIDAATTYAIRDQAVGNRLFAAWDAPADHFSTLRTYSGSASYVTGSHSLRFGGTLGEGSRRLVESFTGDWTYIYNNGTPAFVVLRTPLDQREGIKADVGLFVQDRWTVKRLTVNAGLRLDWFQGEVQEEDVPAGRWNPAQHFARCADGKNNPAALCVGDVQNWKDLNPRLGVSYDLFGNGRTALKASVARYVNGEVATAASQNNPATTIGRTDQRSWTDSNGDFVVQGNPNVPTSNGELGPTTNLNFGRGVPGTVHDPSTLDGWHIRPYSWELATSVQHELFPRVALTVGFARRSIGNQLAVDNILTSPDSYSDPFCISAPPNANLPGGGDYQVCGLRDIKPEFQGRVQNVRKLASEFGGIEDVNTGFDVYLNARLRTGTFIQGGVSAGRRAYDTCNTPLVSAVPGIVSTTQFTLPQVDSPESAETPDGSFCDQVFPFRPDAKFMASHTLPWDIQLSGTFQHSRGVQNPLAPSVLALWPVSNAIIESALGRRLAACPATGACAATKTVSIIQPGVDYGDQNLSQLDLRASKRFRFNRYSFRIDLDLYNAFNSNWPFTVNTNFSTAATSLWLRPTNVLQSRLVKIGGQFDF